MKKFTLSAAIPLFAAGLLAAALPVAAQDEDLPADGTDMSSYLTNADFDGSYDGWTLEGGGVNIGSNLCEAYESQHNGLYLYQDVTGLPMGVYTLTAKGFYRPGWNDGGEAFARGDAGVCPARFFISTATQTETGLLNSLYDTEYVFSSGGLSGYANSMAEARQVFDATDDYLVTMDDIYVGSDGTLRLGIEGIAESYSGLWSIWGDFTLIYKSELTLDGYRSLADGIYNQIYNQISLYNYSGGEALQDSIDALYDIAYGETMDEVEASTNQMRLWLEEANAAVAACDDLSEAIASYQQWITQGYPGASDLTAVYEAVYPILDGAYKDDGTPYFAADIESCVTLLEEAIRNYRLSQDIPEGGLDATFALTNPDFTDETGAGSSEGWTIVNTKADGSAAEGDFRLNYFGPDGEERYWWNNWAAGVSYCANMDVYTEVQNLPAGYYTFSVLHTTDNTILPNQRAYGITEYDEKESLLPTKYTEYGSSGWNSDASYWDTLYVDSVFVGSDGYLRVGMHSTMTESSSAGWFCITDARLTYHGTGESSVNELTRDILLARGDTLLTRDFLAIQQAYLSDAMETLRAADISTDEAANAAFDAFLLVLDSCGNAVSSMADFRTNYYDPIVAMLTTAPTDDLATTIAFFQGMCDEMTTSLTTTVEMFYGVIVPQAAAFLEYANAYIAAYEYGMGSVEEVTSVITTVLSDQNANVTENPLVSDVAAQNVTNLLGFAEAYDNALIELAVEGVYDPDTLTVITGLVDETVEAMLADQDNIAGYTSTISLLINRLRLTAEGLELPDGTRDLTSWIVNANIEDLTDAGGSGTGGDRTVLPNGWEGYTNNGNGCFWTSIDNGTSNIPEGVAAMEAWSSDPSALTFNFYQTLKGMPAGSYRVTVLARDMQTALANGASKLYVSTSEGREYVEPIYSHPVLTGDTLVYDTTYVQVDGVDTDVIDTITTSLNVDDMTYDLYTIDDIWITNDGADMTIGVRRDSLGVCNWFSADDFHLYMIARFNTGIEEVGADSGEELVVYSRNGYIYVEGADEYTVYNVSGVAAYRKDQQLQPGYYIVKAADGRTAKVVVD